MEMLDVYASFKQELSPDEFCIRLFVNEGSREKCNPHHDPVMERFRNIEELKVKFKEISLPKSLTEQVYEYVGFLRVCQFRCKM